MICAVYKYTFIHSFIHSFKLTTLCGKFLNLAHYFPYDVKLGLLADSRSFFSQSKARNAIVGAENLLKTIKLYSFAYFHINLSYLTCKQTILCLYSKCVHFFTLHSCYIAQVNLFLFSIILFTIYHLVFWGAADALISFI